MIKELYAKINTNKSLIERYLKAEVLKYQKEKESLKSKLISSSETKTNRVFYTALILVFMSLLVEAVIVGISYYKGKQEKKFEDLLIDYNKTVENEEKERNERFKNSEHVKAYQKVESLLKRLYLIGGKFTKQELTENSNLTKKEIDVYYTLLKRLNVLSQGTKNVELVPKSVEEALDIVDNYYSELLKIELQ